MINGHFGIMCSVTEYESGWGQRPDGYAIALTKEALLAFGSRTNGNVWGDYNCFGKLDDNFRTVVITDEAKILIEKSEHKVLWVNNPYKYIIKNS